MQTLATMPAKDRAQWFDAFIEHNVVSTIRKSGRVHCSVGELPPNAFEHVFEYGFQRAFNDAVGDNEKFPTVDDKVNGAQAKLDRFIAGQVTAMRGGTNAAVRKIVLIALSDDKRAEHDALDDADAKREYLDSVFDAAADDVQERIRDMAQAEAEREAAERERRKREAAERAEKLDVSL